MSSAILSCASGGLGDPTGRWVAGVPPNKTFRWRGVLICEELDDDYAASQVIRRQQKDESEESEASTRHSYQGNRLIRPITALHLTPFTR